MSSFKDNIGKGDESEALDYDDSAFYFFASTILLVVVVLYTYILLKNMWKGGQVLEHGQKICD